MKKYVGIFSGRMDKFSVENVMVADRLLIKQAEVLQSQYPGSVMVYAEKDGCKAYLCDGMGLKCYPSVSSARRALKRLRPDLEPTAI